MAYLDRATQCLLFLLIISFATGQFIVTTIADSGSGSLRAAIDSANAASGNDVYIYFDFLVFSAKRTITLMSALPPITKSDLTITGPGANRVTISGNDAFQVLMINSGVTNVVISDTILANGFAPVGGACIQNKGELSIRGCVISQCASGSDGGGIYNEGTLEVDSCTLSGNTALIGGAIYSTNSLTVSRSTFTANSANGGGGDAIANFGLATITDSTFNNNGLSGDGRAAIACFNISVTTIQGCTITANHGDNGWSRGLHTDGYTAIANNIIYGNLGTGFDVQFTGGQITDYGYNIIGTWLDFTPDATTRNVDPLLVPLADNGGLTQTCGLAIGSPAIDAGPNTAPTTFDQRDFPFMRLYNGKLDIGAFEAQPIVTNTLDDGSIGSLRWAITLANSMSSGAVTITFSSIYSGAMHTITLTSALPPITKSDLTISGPGANFFTISGDNAVQVFLINNGVKNVAVSGLTISNGESTTNGGCVYNQGELTLTGCVITQCSAINNPAGSGGGLYSDGLLTVSRSTFTANRARKGDALWVGSDAIITDSTFYGNGQLGSGESAIAVAAGTTFIQRCTITANYGDLGAPGGLYVFGGSATIEDSIIYGNLGNSASDVSLLSALIIDNGYNIFGSATGFTRVSPVVTDPLLVLLANNGGPTQTCALGTGSPAINAANPALDKTTDQRGFPQVGRRDIGAFEVQGGSGGGDPSFVGFMGPKFGFHGKANKSFHIFSDPYITINSRFAVANPAKNKGTVMYSFGVRWENHTITFGVDSLIKNNNSGNKETSLLISIDGIENTLPRSNQPTLLDDCINATWSFPKFRINTPLHKIVIDWRSEHKDHINGSYLNIRIDVPLDSPTLCGGVIGQTASAKSVKSISTKDSDFITSDDMISVEAKTSKFTARPMLCAASSTQPPSTAKAAHQHEDATDVHVAHGMRV